MGARGVRLNARHSADVRTKIQTSQIINFLQKHVLQGTEVKKTQISAAIALLRKTIPDLQTIDGGLNLRHSHEDAVAELQAESAPPNGHERPH